MLDTYRTVVEMQERELDSEKRCVGELEEARQGQTWKRSIYNCLQDLERFEKELTMLKEQQPDLHKKFQL